MAAGGIYDHLGGGFARYSTDDTWTVPHFEKMLYDQAGLVLAYLHGWQLTRDPRFIQVVEETVDYVLRDLRAPGVAGLCAAEDADSEGEEGLFYTWTEDEIAAVLSPELASAAIDWYGVTERGQLRGSIDPEATDRRGARASHRGRKRPGATLRGEVQPCPSGARRQGSDGVERDVRVRHSPRRRPQPAARTGRTVRSPSGSSCFLTFAGPTGASCVLGRREPQGIWRTRRTTPGSSTASLDWAS